MRDDVKAAFRSLKKSPTFTAVALVVLALGIGASTAIFSVVDAVVLRGLPFDQHDRLAVVMEHDTKRDTTFGGGATTPQMYLDWRRDQKPFDALAAVGGWSFRLRNERGEPVDARAQRVSWEFFPTLRVAPILGRSFTAEDEILERHRVVMLSYGYWQRRFGGAPDVIGKTIELSEQPWEIVGVLPRGFSYPVASDRPTEMYVPIAFRDDEKVRGGSRNYNWTVIGRLKDGVTLPQAHEQMNVLAAALDEQFPKWSPGQRARVVTLHEHLVGRVRAWMLMLLGAVGLVLLISCTNVANLMLARATTRTREVAIRAALGASRSRLIRGLLVESVVLSLLGAAIGIVLAWGGVQVLRAWLPPGIPRVAGIAMDLRVLAAAIGAAVATGIAFGIVPAFQSSRPDLVNSLKEGSRSATTGAAGQRIRSVLVVAEVALAVLLLVGAGLFIGSFVKLVSVDPGFDYHNVMALNVGVPIVGNNFEDALKRGGPYAQQMVETVGSVPGVQMAGAVAGGLPLTGSWSRNTVTLPGAGKLEGDDDSIDSRTVTPSYHQVMRIPLRRGRYLNDQDREGTTPVVVINETAARKYWPGEDPLGKLITYNSVERTVVGIVGDIRHLGPEQPPRQEGYIPMAQGRVIGIVLVMRTQIDPLRAFPAVQSAIWRVNPDQRVSTDTLTLEAYMDRLIAQRRFLMALLGLFGLLGLVIAAAGMYGVMAYIVAQRTNEIGVRMALGATPGNILGMVLRRATVLIAAGLLLGGAAAWYLSAGVRTFLFEVEPNDPNVFVLAVTTLALAGLAASAVPARRAARVDPVVALRQE